MSCNKSENNNEIKADFELVKVQLGDQIASSSFTFEKVNPNLELSIQFSELVSIEEAQKNIYIQDFQNKKMNLDYSILPDKQIGIKTKVPLHSYSEYQLIIWHDLKAESGASIISGKSFNIATEIDTTPKFPKISDEELLTLVQETTFKYFWDFAHPTSGMARERSTSGDVVTTGGTGFGIMATIIACERGFITRTEGLQHIQKIVDFLSTKCTRYHGAFSHWVNGATGTTMAFSEKDDGADLVETSLLFQGLLTARAYFNESVPKEKELKDKITELWEEVEWAWFRKNENVLYWHWSPKNNWTMNLPIRGWNECLITYLLAASSPTYPINKTDYDKGWAMNGGMIKGQSYYGIPLPLGDNYGGPLFFSQYSFLGINPTNLKDKYANYWEQNRNHALIHYKYCIENPKKFAGYGADCWGLTACDGNNGYSAHFPEGNDRGVIAPTAALSSMPYTPKESMQALHFYYYILGDKIWKKYGFIDAFNLSANWFDDQYLAIDQGPIVVMIENYRSSLIWDLFMSIPEIQNGLNICGFEY